MTSASSGSRSGTRLNASHDDDAEGYDAQRRGSWMSSRRLAYALEHLDREAPSLVLEVGSGTGALLLDVAAARPSLRFVGVEPLPNYVEYANARALELGVANVTFCEGTGESLPVEVTGQSFDMVLSTDTLHHVVDLAAVTRNVHAVTRPGGAWLAMEPNRLNPYMLAYHLMTAGERNFSPQRFLRGARAAGWSKDGFDRLFLIPSAVASPSPWMQRAERRLERVPVLAGGVAVLLRKPAAV